VNYGPGRTTRVEKSAKCNEERVFGRDARRAATKFGADAATRRASGAASASVRMKAFILRFRKKETSRLSVLCSADRRRSLRPFEVLEAAADATVRSCKAVRVG